MFITKEFVPLKDYEGIYVINKNGVVIKVETSKPYIVSTKVNYRTGYVELTLRKNGVSKTKLLLLKKKTILFMKKNIKNIVL